MGDLDVNAIRARVADATPGPWVQWVGHFDVCSGVTEGTNTRGTIEGERVCELDLFRQSSHDPDPADTDCGCEDEGCATCFPRLQADADLIAHAPTDLAALCDEVERLRTENARLTRACVEGLPREVIPCPACGEKHIEGPRHDDPSIDGRVRPHHTHRCYHCGHVWDAGRWSYGVEPGQERNTDPEVKRLRTIIDGSTTAPTDEEISALAKAGGAWLYADADAGALVVCQDGWQARTMRCRPGRWWALGPDGLLRARPEVVS